MLLVLGFLALLQEPRDGITEEQLRVFAAIDKVDPLDTSKLPFVRIFYGRVDTDEPDAPQAHSYVAFLLKDEGATFTVRNFESDTITHTRTVKGTPELERVDHVKADLAEHAQSLAKYLKETDKNDRRFYLGMSGTFDPLADALIVARACARRGMRAEVHRLWDAVEIDKAIEALAEGFSHRLTIDFADPGLDRTQIRDRHKAWIEAFGSSDNRKRVEFQVDSLDRMIREDEERKAKRADGTPTKAEQIADLIYELRNERWAIKEQYFDGHYLGSDPPKPDGSRPSERLVKFGIDAVPALIDSLEDERFTRIVWYSSRFGGGYHVTTVGSLVEEVLQEISGLVLYGNADARKDGWKRWRASVAEKGEEETLATMAAEGGDLAVQAAEILIKKWPRRVNEILRGFRRLKEAHARISMIELLEPLRDDAVTSFLLDELKKGTETAPRVAAARVLLNRGRKEGIDLLSKEWNAPVEFKETTQEGLPPEVQEFDKGIRQSQAREAMSEFLLTSGDLAAVRTVTKDLATASLGIRRSVVEYLWRADLKKLLERCAEIERPGLEKEFEAVLIAALDDKHRQIGASYNAITSPRLADLAALALADFWPTLYPFDASLPSRLRDRRMREMVHGWRIRNGLKSIAPAPVPDGRSKDPEIPNRVAGFISERDAERRRAAGGGLETAGLAALPWIEEGLRTLTPDHPARADLKAVADRLSTRVGSTNLKAGAWKESDAVIELLKQMKGKVLTPEAAVQLMLDAMAALPGKAGTVTLMIDRLADGAGLHVELHMMQGVARGGNSADGVHSVVIGGESQGFSSGGGARSAYDDVDDFDGYRKSLRKALSSPHDCRFEAIYELVHN